MEGVRHSEALLAEDEAHLAEVRKTWQGNVSSQRATGHPAGNRAQAPRTPEPEISIQNFNFLQATVKNP